MDRGTYGLDSSEQLDSNSAANSGSRWQARYSAGAGNGLAATQFKLCKTGELQAILASGQDFLAVSEWYESRITEGAGAGAQDGASDLAFWQGHGLAQGSTIYCTWDEAPDGAKFAGVIAYIDAYNAALQGYYVGDGLYAGILGLVPVAQQMQGRLRHGWVTESASWSCAKAAIDPSYAPPAKTNWDLWEPTKSQVDPALAYLDGLTVGSGLQSIIWQSGNHWFGSAADENIILLAGSLGMHNDHTGAAPAPAPAPATEPAPAPAPAPAPKPLQPPWPSGFGPNDYLGSISGPSNSHGGDPRYDGPDVIAAIKWAQQMLILGGNVPGISDPNSSWADGVYGPETVAACAAWQHRDWAPQTSLFGEIWSDDYSRLQ